MRQHRQGMNAAGLGIMVALAGCAQTTVRPEQETSAIGLRPPEIVLVYRFGVNASEVTENQGIFQQAINATDSTTQGERANAIAEQVSNRLADQLVTGINGLGMAATRATRDTYVPPGALVITGRFVDINEGNRLRRLVIGLGAGQSTVDTQVKVLAHTGGQYRPLLEFQTHADSGAMPGAALTMGAGAAASGGASAGMAVANAAATGVKGYRTQVEAMAGRSADRAVEYLSQFFANQGWIPPDMVKRPLLP
jgi:hypothetical protein